MIDMKLTQVVQDVASSHFVAQSLPQSERLFVVLERLVRLAQNIFRRCHRIQAHGHALLESQLALDFERLPKIAKSVFVFV